ncbi:AttH component of AttEFGH ABC transport system [Rhodovulum sp. P5]|uniref:lipocalin-like domain-containing protein n=1 Tax=Rhodovulum sp. P5 TaxID=1564506 RepID=UPI0009C1EAA3|nr:lipocalin-like domain-containing protein [Rhodovulum sp. P5]ARE41365.1 AttH component of AttEFGH ABC transport system [Rhodovulum sp. P5]
MNARALILALLLPLPAFAQGFAGLGQTADGYTLPERGHALTFPQDHGPHPGFRIEWWYLTANLTGEDGTGYGIQWTLFRNALAPRDDGTGWQATHIWMGNAGLTTPTAHYSAMRLARGGIGQGGVTPEPFEAWIDDWRMESTAPADADPLSALTLTASAPDFAYDLALTADGPLVLHGEAGYSVKSDRGNASYYYSQPFYRLSGTLTLPEGEVQVTGKGWLDREWSSQPLDADQEGWDWVSLHFDDGAKLMAFRLRADSGDYTTGTWIARDGAATPLAKGAVTMTPLRSDEVAGRTIPVRWRIALPARDLEIEIEALNDGAWMDTAVDYWEGPVQVTGNRSGVGYLEMTGYD